MSSYILPQVKIAQELKEVPESVVNELNAFVFGPNYELFRHSESDEKSLIDLGDYNRSSDEVYDYPSKPAGSTVDTDYVKVFLDDVWAEYIDIPASEQDPVVVSSASKRNRLRAAPHIADASEGSNTGGVLMDTGGYYMGGIDLPENYYLFAKDTGELGAEDVVLEYVTSEGHTGSGEIAASEDPLVSGTRIKGPDGLVYDFDSGTRQAGILSYSGDADVASAESISLDVAGVSVTITASGEGIESLIGDIRADGSVNAVNDPDSSGDGGRIILYSDSAAIANLTADTTDLTVGQAGGAWDGIIDVADIVIRGSGTDSFRMTLKDSAVRDVFDDDIDNGNPLTLTYVDGSLGVDLTNGTITLTAATTDTLADVYGALPASVKDMFEITGGTDSTENFDAVSVAGEVFDTDSAPVAPDAYRVRISANEYIWGTNQVSDHSSHFKDRGVKVGDRLSYSFTGTDGELYTGMSRVTGMEADTTVAAFGSLESNDANTETQSGASIAHDGGLDIIEAGSDNQRDFDGSATGVYALDPDTLEYAGSYASAVLSEKFTIKITSSGVAGEAFCSVTGEGTGIERTGVRVEKHPDGDGMIYLADNLWVRLEQGSSDADDEFKYGDTYTFGSEVDASWTAVPAGDLTLSGEYDGPSDTTYRLEVVRGGVFTREAVAMDGLDSPQKLEVEYYDTPDSLDTITIDGNVVEIGSDVVRDTDADATYANLVDYINNDLNARVFAEQTVELIESSTSSSSGERGKIVISGDHDIIDSITHSLTYASSTKRLAPMTVSLDWNAGDVDDEYVIRCVSSGNINSALFDVTSVRGDNDERIAFEDNVSRSIGSQGLSATVDVGSVTDYEFGIGDTYVVKVYGARPQLKITDSANIDESVTRTVSAGETIPLGTYGGYVSFSANSNDHGGLTSNDGGLVKGDVFSVEASGHGDGSIRTLVLADNLPKTLVAGSEDGDSNYDPTEISIWLYSYQNSVEVSSERVQSPPNYNWEASEDSLTVYSGIEVRDPTWTDGGSQVYIPVDSAEVYAEYRALLDDYSDTIHSMSVAEEITGNRDAVSEEVARELGTVDTDNPLAQGVYNALLNSSGEPVYYMAVPSDDRSGYESVLNKASLTDLVYFMAPLTSDGEITSLVDSHIDEMSTDENKRWRLAFVTSELPETEDIYTAETSGTDTAYKATVEDNPDTDEIDYTLVTITNNDPAVLEDVSVGDTVRLSFSQDAWGNETYTAAKVSELLTSNSFLIENGLDSAVETESKVEVVHDLTVGEKATAVAANAEAYANRRMFYVAPLTAYADGKQQRPEFVASAISGLASSVVPQRSLTSMEVKGFDSIPACYNTFNRSQLDEMAGAGVFIVMQDMPGEDIYVRHSVSTAASDGNLLTSEIMVTKNFDAISYYFADMLEPYYGKYNVTDELLRILRTKIKAGFRYLGSGQVSTGMLGPMVILDDGNTKVRTLKQHPTMKDHIIIEASVELPMVANVIDFRMVASV